MSATATGSLNDGAITDSGFFRHRSVGEGDDIRVCLASVSATGISGAMIRDSDAPDSAFVFAGSDGTGKTIVRYRHKRGAPAQSIDFGPVGASPWFRLVVGRDTVYAYAAGSLSSATPGAWSYLTAVKIELTGVEPSTRRSDLGGLFVSRGPAIVADVYQSEHLLWSERTTRITTAVPTGAWTATQPTPAQTSESSSLLSLVGSGTPADVNFVDFPIQVRAPGTYRFFVHIPSGNPASIRAALVVGGVRQAVFTPDNTPSGRSSWLFVDSAPLAANATVSVRLLHPGTQGTALYADAARAVLVPNSEVGVTGYPGWTKTPAGTNRITFAGSGASNELKRSQHDLNGNWNAGAFSTNALLGDGKLRFRFIGDGLQMQAGLTLSAASSDPAHITYRFTNKNSGKVQALGGTSAEFNYVNGDWMEIERVGRQMIFRRNSTFLHAIALAPSAPAYLHVDASLLEENARLFGTQISGHWIHPAWSTNIDYDAFTDSTERPVIDADAEDSLQSIFDVNLSEDLDLDGLTNAQEVANGTLPENPDTDGDGLSDGAEVNTHGTNPTNPDTDNDGLEDGFEVHSVYGFDPTKRFTINDGVSDFTRWEILEFDPNDEFSELADVLAGADFDLDGVNNRHESADGTSAIDRNDWFRPVVFDRLFGDFEGADWTIDQIDGVNSSRLARNAPGDTPAGAVSHHEAIDGTRVRFQFSNLLANSSLADQIAVGFSHRGMDADEAGDFPNYAVSIRPVGAGEARLYFLDSPAPNTSPFTVTPTDLLELRLELTGAAQKLHVEKNQQALVTVDLPPGFLSFDLETNPLAVVTRLGAGSNTVHNLRYRGIYDPDRDEDQMADRWEQRIVDFYPQFTTVEEVFPGGDSDNDTLTNIEEYNRGTDPTNPDTDGDGMPDGWEVAYGLNPKNPTDGTETLNPDGTPAADLDGDGLSNRAEYDFGSRPDRISTALDGFSDAWRQRWNLNPLAALDPGVDADEDGLTNGEEYTLGTNPNVKDSDGDGFEDGWEVANGFDPLYDDRITDSDEDGLLNTDELAAGTDPLNPDSDGDDLKDGDEIHTYLTDPLNPDTDGDGLPDGWEIAGLIMHFGHQFQPGEPIVRNHTYGEWNLMSSVELEPTVDSTPIHQAWERTVFQYDWYYNSTFPVQETLYRTQTRLNDGTIVEPQDGWVHDTVKNTLTRPNQITRWTVEYDENLRLWVGVHQTPEQISTWWWVVTDPLSGDTDEDGLPDGWEYSHWLNPDRTADAGENPDNDGLINSAEFTAGTHPWRADTDGDLLNDGHEVNVSLSNPLDPMDPGTAGGATPPLIPVRPVATRVEILSVQPSPTPGGTLVPRRAPTLSGRGGRAPGGPGAQVPVASTPIAGPLPSNPGAAAQDRPSPPPSGELYLEFRTMDKSLFGPMAELEGGGDPVWNEDLQIWELAGGGGPNPGDPDGDDWFGITRQDIKGINEANESAKTKDEPPARNFLDQAKIDHETDWQKDEAEPLATASVSGKGRHYSTVATEVRLVRKANAASPESYANVQVAVKRQFLKVTRKRPVPPTGSNGGDWTVVKAEKLELTIPVNQSKSVADNQHPLPGNAFEPKMEKDWEYEVILLPVELTWEEVDSEYPELEDNVNPFTDETQGTRIFPGKKDPSDQIRNKVTLKVDVGIEDIEVFVKAFDVDDPTPTGEDPGSLIDPNDQAGEGKGDDNRDDGIGTPKTGKFTMSGSATANKKTNAEGIAEFEFEVGMQPGNNYRVAVSVQNVDGYSNEQVTDPSGDGYLGPREDQASVAASPLLTVWRKLNLEMDSMQMWEGDKPHPDRNMNAGIAWQEDDPSNPRLWSELLVTVEIPLGEDFYAGGRVKSGGVELDIMGNTITSITVKHPNGTEPLTQTQKDAFLGVFEMFDDDDSGLSGDPLPRLDLIDDEVKSKFRPAYIEVEEVDESLNPNRTIPFSPNNNIYNPDTALDDSQDLTGSDVESYWYHMVITAYQPTLTTPPNFQGNNYDLDPNTEEPFLLGATGISLLGLEINNHFSVMFVETIRDSNGGRAELPNFEQILQSEISRITAHEIGHPPGGYDVDSDHTEGGLMGDGAEEANYFFPITISRFRSALKWNP